MAVVSTYPPRACGIATFARDLREALRGAAGVPTSTSWRSSATDGADQAPEVVARIRQEVRGDYVAAAGRSTGAATTWS